MVKMVTPPGQNPDPAMPADGYTERSPVGRLELEESCNTALRCKCGSQSFRIFMEVDESSNELSAQDANGVECNGCHELFQIKLVRDDALVSRC
jgi:hypothetical protein